VIQLVARPEQADGERGDVGENQRDDTDIPKRRNGKLQLGQDICVADGGCKILKRARRTAGGKERRQRLGTKDHRINRP